MCVLYFLRSATVPCWPWNKHEFVGFIVGLPLMLPDSRLADDTLVSCWLHSQCGITTKSTS